MALHSADATACSGIVFVDNLVVATCQYILCIFGKLDTCEAALFAAEFLDEFCGLAGADVVTEVPEFRTAFARGADEEITAQLDGVDGAVVASEELQ